ncbi:MAG: hypothetical protein JWP00_2232 [Chloroflexi bacterium]|jgi:hypothetical protein|nr:hypothetical protein [Chloroflexota bacterium]
MTYAKEFLARQRNYHQARQNRVELPLRLRLFLFLLATISISFGVMLASLIR